MKFIIIILTTNIVFGFSSSLSDSSKFTTNEIRFYSDITIDSSEIITNNIRILGGGLTVYGTVESQITVIGGDVHILSSAIINGKIKVGLSDKDIQILVKNNNIYKVTTNNLAIIVNNKFNGATTVGSTINIASKIGIKFFATGGIGGVHLNSEQTLDVSSDLYELSKNNICVVCSGAKSILDINKTYEKLESLGIPRIGYKTKYMPGFWYYQTDNLLDYNFTKISELVKYLKVNQILQNNNGALLLLHNSIFDNQYS